MKDVFPTIVIEVTFFGNKTYFSRLPYPAVFLKTQRKKNKRGLRIWRILLQGEKNALQQVGKDKADDFLRIAKLTTRNIYMDSFAKSKEDGKRATGIDKTSKSSHFSLCKSITNWGIQGDQSTKGEVNII